MLSLCGTNVPSCFLVVKIIVTPWMFGAQDVRIILIMYLRNNCSYHIACDCFCFNFCTGVVAELELSRPLFPGKTELEEIDMICKLLGTPGEDSWSQMKTYPEYRTLMGNLPKYTSSLGKSYTSRLSDPLVKFLERVLVFDPNKRFSAKQCIEDSTYFVSHPLPEVCHTDTIQLPSGFLSLLSHYFCFSSFVHTFISIFCCRKCDL